MRTAKKRAKRIKAKSKLKNKSNNKSKNDESDDEKQEFEEEIIDLNEIAEDAKTNELAAKDEDAKQEIKST